MAHEIGTYIVPSLVSPVPRNPSGFPDEYGDGGGGGRVLGEISIFGIVEYPKNP